MREIIYQAQLRETTRIGEEESKITDKFREDQGTEEMSRYRNETGRYAFWRGRFTEDFKKWLEERNLDLEIVEANRQEKLEQFETDPMNRELNKKKSNCQTEVISSKPH